MELIEELGFPKVGMDIETELLSIWTYLMGSIDYGLGLKFYNLKISFAQGKVNKMEIEEKVD